MPSQMVHLAVAYNILQHVDIKKQNQFYLGAIAPDAIHMRNGITREEKNKTHLLSRDKEIWQKDISMLLSNIKSDTNPSFTLGYGAHLYTDMIWYNTVYRSVKNSYIDDVSASYYNDTDVNDILLYNTHRHRKHIWNLLESANAVDFKGIVTAREIDKWKHHVLVWFDNNHNEYQPITYITKDTIKEFISNASNTVTNYLNQAI